MYVTVTRYGKEPEWLKFVTLPAPGDRVVLNGWTWFVRAVKHYPTTDTIPYQPVVEIDVVKYASEAGGNHG
jgi:hypothetical protein